MTQKHWETLKRIVDLFSGLAVIFTLIFIALQWREMHLGGKDTHDLAVAARDQAIAAKDQATAAKDQATAAKDQSEAAVRAIALQQKIAQDALEASQRNLQRSLLASVAQTELDQRAWIGLIDTKVEPIEIGKGITAHVAFQNTGKTLAKNVQCVYRLRLSPSAWTNVESIPFSDTISRAILLPGGSYERTWVGTSEISETIKQRVEGGWFTYIFGEVIYMDIFEKPHKLLFCEYRHGTEPILQCPFHNDSN